MRTLRFASVGGWHIHTDRFLLKVNDYPGCMVTTVWDPDAMRGMARAERLNASFVEQYEMILEDPLIDGVLITSPTRDHYDQIKKAIEAGKHIFVEKPAFYTKEEAYDIKKMLEGTDIKFLVSDPIRTSVRQLLCAREIMEAGRIGKITTVRTRCAMPMAVNYTHLDSFNPDISGGGIMYDLGCHAVHMLHMLVGRPAKAHAAFSGASVAAKEYGVEDNAVAVYEFENGILGIAETSALSDRREDFFLVSGLAGSICCMDKELRFRTEANEWVNIPPDIWPEEKVYPLYNWIDSIGDGTKIEGGGIDEAVEFTEMIVSAYKASTQTVDV